MPDLGAGSKDASFQIELIVHHILLRNDGERVLFLVADCGPLIRNGVIAIELEQALLRTERFDAVVVIYLYEYHSKQRCDANFGAMYHWQKLHDLYIAEEICQSAVRDAARGVSAAAQDNRGSVCVLVLLARCCVQ